MPALVLFCRKWRVATDDFVFPGIFDLFVTVNWIIASVIVYWASDRTWECSGKEKITIFLYGIFSLLNLIAVASSMLVYYSKAGGIMDTQARKLVPRVLYTRLFLQFLGLIWNVIGTIWILDGSLDCSTAPHAVCFIKGYVICNWIFIFLATIGVIIVYDPFGRDGGESNENSWNFTTQENYPLPDLPYSKNARVWTRRLRVVLFNFFICSSSRKNGLLEAGKLFGRVFENTDLVPTDVIAGLLLLRLQKKDAHKAETLLQRMSMSSISDSNAEKPAVIPVINQPLLSRSIKADTLEQLFRDDWRNPRLLSHFIKFAMASYTWPLVLFDRQPHPIPKLCSTSYFCGCIPGRKHPLNVVDDDCCFCCTSGVRRIADVEDSNLIHLCFTNEVFKTPFFIAKDVVTKSIIVSIRGTLSNADIITDMTGLPIEIDPRLPSSFKGHHGMVLCATALKERLEKLNIIPKLLNENPGYNLIFTGTSLGAGTAAILSLMLKDTYPLLKCYAYSPPGGLLSMDAAVCCNDFTTSAIYGNDIITRLSIRSIEKLKHSLIEAINSSKTPKYQIILGMFSMCRGGRPTMVRTTSKSQAVSQNTCSSNHQVQHVKDFTQINFPSDDFKRGCDDCDYNIGIKSHFTHVDIDETKSTLNSEPEKLVPCVEMYPPGKIVYITETPEFSLGHRRRNYCGSARWRMRWADRTEFGEIIIHDRLIGDHLPYRMRKALEVLSQSQAQIGRQV